MNEHSLKNGTVKQRVYWLLEKEGELTNKQIASSLNITPNQVARSLHDMKQQGTIGKRGGVWAIGAEHDSKSMSLKIIEMIESGEYTRREIASKLGCSDNLVSCAVCEMRDAGLNVKLVYKIF